MTHESEWGFIPNAGVIDDIFQLKIAGSRLNVNVIKLETNYNFGLYITFSSVFLVEECDITRSRHFYISKPNQGCE